MTKEQIYNAIKDEDEVDIWVDDGDKIRTAAPSLELAEWMLDNIEAGARVEARVYYDEDGNKVPASKYDGTMDVDTIFDSDDFIADEIAGGNDETLGSETIPAEFVDDVKTLTDYDEKWNSIISLLEKHHLVITKVWHADKPKYAKVDFRAPNLGKDQNPEDFYVYLSNYSSYAVVGTNNIRGSDIAENLDEVDAAITSLINTVQR
jgi:hypothetical protein